MAVTRLAREAVARKYLSKAFEECPVASLTSSGVQTFMSPRVDLLDNLSEKPFLRKVIQRFPDFIKPQAVAYGHVIAINGEGEILLSLQDPSGAYPDTTSATETADYLYIGSLVAPVLARIEKSRIGL